MSLEDVKGARAMIEGGPTKAQVAARFGVSRQSLYRNLEREA
ncbi:helix-turn-helix domain-containing protein [Desulfoluna spongiiphila]|nr:helix-turn-helix domain-containing protein [Desulfoluna spongiiphila]